MGSPKKILDARATSGDGILRHLHKTMILRGTPRDLFSVTCGDFVSCGDVTLSVDAASCRRCPALAPHVSASSECRLTGGVMGVIPYRSNAIAPGQTAATELFLLYNCNLNSSSSGRPEPIWLCARVPFKTPKSGSIVNIKWCTKLENPRLFSISEASHRLSDLSVVGVISGGVNGKELSAFKLELNSIKFYFCSNHDHDFVSFESFLASCPMQYINEPIQTRALPGLELPGSVDVSVSGQRGLLSVLNRTDNRLVLIDLDENENDNSENDEEEDADRDDGSGGDEAGEDDDGERSSS
jgi:hypothetical protein